MNNAVKEDRSDSLETQVYYVDSLDLFHLIDYHVRPKAGDWVVVVRVTEPGIAIQRYCGQCFIGVARILDFYQLAQSEQQILSSMPVYPD